MDYIGLKFPKSGYDSDLYTAAAKWCNSTQEGRIIERAACYEVVAMLPPPEPTFDELKMQKKAEIAAARYEKETGGVEVEGAKIATDRGSQALLTAAVVTARFDPEFQTRWKCDDGTFVTLNAIQLRAIGDAVTAFIENCFAREGELCELVNAAETKEDLDAIEISF